MNEYDIAKMYQKMELELISSLKRNLKRHLKEEKNVGIDYPAWQALKLKELQRVKEENLEIIKKHTSTIPRDVSRIINREYKQGRISAQKLFAKSKEGHGDKMNQSFFYIDNQKVNMLIDEINGTVRNADSAMFRMMNDKYRSTIFKANFFLENGATTIDGAIDMALRDFIKSGINCIEYADGRRVNIADYTRMAVRTASQRAMLYAEGDFRKERGKSLVMVTKHNTACKMCQPWENKVLIDDIYSGGIPDGKHKLVSQAMKAGLFHPSCRHGLPTYYPELDYVYDDIAKGKTLQEEEDSLRDSISQYYQRERRMIVWNNPNSLNQLNLFDKNGKELEEVKNISYNISNKEFSNKYESILNEMRRNATPNSHEVKELNKFILNGKIYDATVDELIFSYTKKEKEIAELIERTFGGETFLLPNMGNYNNKKVSDYFWNDERWDLKEIKKDTKGKNAFTNQAKKAKGQSNNIIIDIQSEEFKNEKRIYKELSRIYGSEDYKYIDKVMVIKDNYIFGVYKRI